MTKEEQIIAFSRSDAPQWFVMRDLKRNNAKLPAYKMLSEMKIEIFTPMKWKIVTKEKKRIPQKVPFMQDLLFVHVTRKVLDPIIRKSKFPWFPERSVQFSGKRTKRSVQKKGCTQHL